jgi:hypothetical protein
MLTYTQAQIRFVGASKDKTPIGMIGPGDATAFAKIAQSAVDNGWSFNEYLDTWAKYATPPAAKVKDTSTTYNKQVSTALLLKDEGDARVAWNNAYFTAYGSYPPEASNATFKNAWNSQVKSQASTSSTQYVISYEPVLDKNGKQVLDKLGKPSYNAVTKSTTSSTGEGFTVPEQQQFLSDYLVKNHPSSTWDIKTLGGQAKTTYDDLISTISANYGATQDLSTLGPVIAQALGNADPKVSAEVIKKFKDDQRKAAGIKYMSLADYTNAGDDANKYVKPLLDATSAFLESNVTIDDPVIKQFLNFQGSDGKYRLPNDYEIGQTLIKDPRYLKTSKAINEAVNVAQSLKNQLGR